MKTFLALYPPLSLALFGALLLAITWFGACVLLFGILDARGRYRDYKYLSRFTYITPRLADYYGQSRCGRSVVIACGMHDDGYIDWKKYYREKGFKWWHFLPVGWPGVMFQRRFWQALVTGHAGKVV